MTTPDPCVRDLTRILPLHLDRQSPKCRGTANANGILQFGEDQLRVEFSGAAGVYQLKCLFDDAITADGYGARLSLADWDEIQYVAIGYTDAEVFVHVKIRHVLQGHDVCFSTSHDDLAFLLQNQWQKREAVALRDLRIFIKGTPRAGGRSTLVLNTLDIWRTADEQALRLAEPAADERLEDALYGYWEQCFPDFAQRADAFMLKGLYPAGADVQACWALSDERPQGHDAVSTNRFAWHALHAVSILLLAYRRLGNIACAFAARDWVLRWIERSYNEVDPDQKFAWYDHGTAERSAVLVSLWRLGKTLRFDYRFMAKLQSVLYRHTQLLASDAFYALHQATRFHNHACFQDVALIAAATCQSSMPEADTWLDKAEQRLLIQLEHLVHVEQGVAVFTENSIGYHCRMQELMALASSLLQLSGRGEGIARLSQLMANWSTAFQYPDGRWPCHGDSFRKADLAIRLSADQQMIPGMLMLPQAGYCLVKSHDQSMAWVLGVVATNLNATHKQQDDLSCFLWLDGVEWLTDPSFYSHEYQQPQTAYLRSPRAHNMLHIPQVAYSCEPRSGRATLEAQQHSDGVAIDGLSRAQPGLEIQRRLECSASGVPFALRVTDRFEVVDIAQDPVEGELTFHFGEGVQVTPLAGSTECWMFRLSHPATARQLLLSIQTPACAGQETVRVEASFCGTGFLEKVPSAAIRVKVLPCTDCRWTLNVTAA